MPEQLTLSEQKRRVHQCVSAINSDKLAGAELERAVDLCIEYECWDPVFRGLHRLLKSQPADPLAIYSKLARVQCLHLDDLISAADTCALAVRRLKLGYGEVATRLIPPVAGQENYDVEARLLESCLNHFTKEQDKEVCLERLCMIYEKKKFNESKLEDTQHRLYDVAPLNRKALRYFKTAFTQAGNWEEVVRILESLLSISEHPMDTYRVAQELASTQLYQLDNPEAALKTLANYCRSSPLETSTIAYEAYERLGNDLGCIDTLKAYLNVCDDPRDKAGVNYRMGVLWKGLRNFEQAQDCFEKAYELAPDVLESAEQLVDIDIERKDWSQVISRLENLLPELSDPEHKSSVKNAIVRVRSALIAENATQ